MKQSIKILTGCCLLLTMLFTACTKNLDRQPNNGIFADSVYNSLSGYKTELAKVYSAFALTGSNGPGSSDLGGIDAGTSDFLRLYWNAQELSTDEAVCAWNDPGIPDFHNLSWTSSNTLLTGLYNRCLYQITVANAYISQCSAASVASHGITDTTDITHYRAEARFLRAYQYWVLMDLFSNPPFVTENDPIGGKFLPAQIKRSDLFNFIESELLAVEPDLIAARQNEYGRADQAAGWALLSRLYLNAGVYTGTARYSDAANYAQKVINAGYSLMPNYKQLFYADNNLNNTEEILTINYDALQTQNYGGTTFLVNASINSDMDPSSFGVPSGGWGGNRTTEKLPDLFPDISGTTDQRALFYGDKKQIDNISTFTDGLRVTKWRNVNSDGSDPANAGTFCNIDFPLFRLGEMYLTYAEAALRGGGDNAKALEYFNKIRERAYGNNSGDFASITLQDVLDERSRELYWEAIRRTDLIRYGQFTSSVYVWPWKAGLKDGTGVSDKYNTYPIPSTDVIANTKSCSKPGLLILKLVR